MYRLVTYNKENRQPSVTLLIIIFVTNNWWVYLPKPHDQWKCPYLGQLAPHSWNRIINNVFLIIRPMMRMEKKPKLLGSLYISGKLPTYPSPKPTLTITSHLGQNVGFREGYVGRWAWGGGGRRYLRGWQSPEMQPNAISNLDNPEGGIHSCTLTLLTGGT